MYVHKNVELRRDKKGHTCKCIHHTGTKPWTPYSVEENFYRYPVACSHTPLKIESKLEGNIQIVLFLTIPFDVAQMKVGAFVECKLFINSDLCW